MKYFYVFVYAKPVVEGEINKQKFFAFNAKRDYELHDYYKV